MNRHHNKTSQAEETETGKVKMSGKVCMVTGANSGLGYEIALTLAKMGATVVLVCRNNHRGEEARKTMISALLYGDYCQPETPSGQINNRDLTGQLWDVSARLTHIPPKLSFTSGQS